MAKKIYFFEANPVSKEYFPTLLAGGEYEVEFFDEKLTKDTVEKAKEAEIVSVFIDSQVTKEVIDAMPNLKFIATRSTGFDHIDVKHAYSKNIPTGYTPGYGAVPIAEITFALMMSMSRRVYDGYHQLRDGVDFSPANLEGFDLAGKTLGVIGTGAIGKSVIRIAKAFLMNVVAYDVFKDEEFAKQMGFEYSDLDGIYSKSDIITLHAPANASTIHMLNGDAFAKMKKGVYVVNTARGDLIETRALLAALASGQVAGFAADVLEDEKELKGEVNMLKNFQQFKDPKTMLESHMLIDSPKVVITPHIGANTKETKRLILKMTAENITGNFAGSIDPKRLVPKPQN